MRIGGTRPALVLSALAVVAALGMPPAAAAGSGGLDVKATVGGHSLKDAGSNSPITLKPSDSTVVEVAVTNNGSSPVDVRSVRLDARVLGLAFFSYTTRVDLSVAPGATGTRTFALDLGDLDGQATGLLPARLALLAPDRSVLASESGTVDVKGKLTSVYGVFGLAVLAITALLLLSLLVRLVRRTLPDSRWSRALAFAVPGLGLGLVVAFTLGIFRIAVPSQGLAVGLLVGGLLVGFGLGYLTPSPGDESDRDELDEGDVVAAPPPAASTTWTRPTLQPASRITPQVIDPLEPEPARPMPAPPEELVRPMAQPPTGPTWPAHPTEAVRSQEPARPTEAVRPVEPEKDDPRHTRVVGPPDPPRT